MLQSPHADLSSLQVPLYFKLGGEFSEETGHGVRNGLLLVVPIVYFLSAVLFAVLGVVVWVGHRTGRLKKDYVVFHNDTELIRDTD